MGCFQGKLLQDDRTLADCGVQHESTVCHIASCPQGITIYVTISNRTVITVHVGHSDNVGDIKKIIRDMQGIPPDQQRLTFAGEELEDEYTPSDYSIQRESRL